MTDLFDITPEPGRQLPIIAGVEITTDAHGRFNLNALHRASGGEKSKQPSNWQRLESTKALIDELKIRSSDLRIAPVEATKGGDDRGTFANELLAIDYAGWISPAFRLQVHQVFIDFRTGKLASAAPIDLDDPAQLVPLLTSYARRTQIAEAKVAEQAPKVEAFDSLMNAEGLYGLQNAGRALSARPNKFVDWLKEEHLFYQGSALVPRVQFIQRGLFVVRTKIVDDVARPSTFITPKGLDYLRRIIPTRVIIGRVA